VKCGNCLKPGHHSSQCESDVVCKTCLQSGHKRGDPVCTLNTDDALSFPPLHSSPSPSSLTHTADLIDLSSQSATDSTVTVQNAATDDDTVDTTDIAKSDKTDKKTDTPLPKPPKRSSKKDLEQRGRKLANIETKLNFVLRRAPVL
jgi:hypothetical protein